MGRTNSWRLLAWTCCALPLSALVHVSISASSPAPTPSASSAVPTSASSVAPTSANGPQSADDLKSRADSGDSKAAYALGLRYFTGEQVERNRILAKHYLTKAAEAGDLRAMNMLGLMSDPLWSDDPSSKDVATAVFWYRRAAQQGFESSLNNLSELKKRGYIRTEIEASPAPAQVAVPAPVAAPAQVAVPAPVAAPAQVAAPAPVAAPASTPVAVPTVPAAAAQPVPLSAVANNRAPQSAPEPTNLPLKSTEGLGPVSVPIVPQPVPTPVSVPVVSPLSVSPVMQSAPVMDGRDLFKARSSSLVEIIGDGNYGSGVILGVLWNRPEDAILRTAMQDIQVNYPFIAATGTGSDSTSLPAGSFLVIISNAHVMEGTRLMEIGYGVDPRGQTMFKKPVAGVCFPTDNSVDLAVYFVPVEASELQLNGVISYAPLPIAAVVPETGSRIFALANPERMARSIAQGLLSGLRPDLIQFDAPISNGSSGGAVFDERGNLLGIILGYLNEAGAQNLNFAIPAERIRPLMLGAGALCYRAGQGEPQSEKTSQGTR